MKEKFHKIKKRLALAALVLSILLASAAVSGCIYYAGLGTEEKQSLQSSAEILSSTVSPEVLEKLAAIKVRLDALYLFNDKMDVDYDTGIIKGYVNSLGDPYTVYYTPDEYKDLMETTNGTYYGVGAVLQQNMETGIITIINPYKGCPAYEAGMQKGDYLFKVAGEEVTGQDLSLVVTKIKGEEGTTVDVTIYRPSEDRYIDMTVERREIQIRTVEYAMYGDKIGCIVLSSFEEPTYSQFMEAYDKLKAAGMETLIVDLRDNGGGLVSSVTDILDKLLPEGTITYTEDRDGKQEFYTSDADSILDIPCFVLCNGYSASASEIFISAMQDYHKATIVGTQSFGKGIVQVILPLEDGSALKVTTSRYYTPNGVCIHGEGITPDHVVEYDLEAEEDNQLMYIFKDLLGTDVTTADYREID